MSKKDTIQNNLDPIYAKPTKAFIIYEGEEGMASYAEVHEISKRGNDFVLGAGSPVMRNTLANLKSLLDKGAAITVRPDILPKQLLYLDTSEGDLKMIWFSKAQPRELKFTDEKFCGTYNLPVIVYQLVNDELSIFMTDSPGENYSWEETRLFIVPLPNCDDNGSVCLGNVQLELEDKSCAEIIEEVENKFWSAQFTDEFRAYKDCEEDCIKMKYDPKFSDVLNWEKLKLSLTENITELF